MKFHAGQLVAVGGHIVHQDGSGTPKKSPLSISETVTELVPPDGAIFCYLRGRDQAIRFGSVSDLSAGYTVLLGGEWSQPIACADGKSIFVRTDAAGTTTDLDFFFEVA